MPRIQPIEILDPDEIRPDEKAIIVIAAPGVIAALRALVALVQAVLAPFQSGAAS